MAHYLQGYDRDLSHYLVTGFQFGFSLSSLMVSANQPCNNLHSAYQFPDVVNEKISSEINLGRISGPFSSPPVRDMVFSPLGLQPKKTPGQFRVIHHLSYPQGNSVNSGIPRECATVKYASVGQAIRHIVNTGRGSYLAKTDIKSAFRIVPVNPEDYHLLGFYWEGQYYYDRCLPMGCSSSCSIFEAFSTALEWVIQSRMKYVKVIHILDDFLFIAPTLDLCTSALSLFQTICLDIGVPLAPEKTVGPYQSLEFAGIHLDTRDMSASLPQDKVTKFLKCLDTLSTTKSATLKQIQSLAGMLNFACGVIAPARAFSRRLYNLSTGLTKPYHHRKVTSQVKSDLQVWRTFLLQHNRKTFFLDYKFLSQQVLQLYTDASTTIGYGGYLGSKWFSGRWPLDCSKTNIAILEIYPIFLAIKLWGSSLANKCILLNSDNMAVVHILNTFTSKDKTILSILRAIVLELMIHNILVKSSHICGKNNVCSDLLSRDQVPKALQLYPYLDRTPTPVPSHLQLNRFL